MKSHIGEIKFSDKNKIHKDSAWIEFDNTKISQRYMADIIYGVGEYSGCRDCFREGKIHVLKGLGATNGSPQYNLVVDL